VENASDARLLTDKEWAEIAITSGMRVVHDKTPGTPNFKNVATDDLVILGNAYLSGGKQIHFGDAFTLTDVPGAAVIFAQAKGEKCARCWMVLEEVGSHSAHPDLCNRCADAVG
jgi:isoleucyl-tRNA synthetase